MNFFIICDATLQVFAVINWCLLNPTGNRILLLSVYSSNNILDYLVLQCYLYIPVKASKYNYNEAQLW